MKILLGHLIGLTPRRSSLLFFEVTLKKFSPHKKSHKTLCSTFLKRGLRCSGGNTPNERRRRRPLWPGNGASMAFGKALVRFTLTGNERDKVRLEVLHQRTINTRALKV